MSNIIEFKPKMRANFNTVVVKVDFQQNTFIWPTEVIKRDDRPAKILEFRRKK